MQLLAGDTLFFARRIDGRDCLQVMLPDRSAHEAVHTLVESTDVLRFWLAGRALVVASPWPRAEGGLALRVFDAGRVRELCHRPRADLHRGLADSPRIAGFSLEPRPLPEPVFALLDGHRLALPGMSPQGWSSQDHGPALYLLDGRDAVSRVVPLPFLDPHALPSALVPEPGTDRHWLTVGDAHHLLVLSGPNMTLEGDVVWSPDQRGLARVAFHPARAEAWVSVGSSVFIVDRKTLQVTAELHIEPELRWHRGQQVPVAAGGIVFSQDGSTVWVARPHGCEVLAFDTRSRKLRSSIPVALDPLELVHGPGRVYAQGLRNGAIGWFPVSE